MPPVSESQRRAMGAAASGKSSLGIPKKVGREFLKSDPGGKLPAKSRVKGFAEGGKVNPNLARYADLDDVNRKVPRTDEGERRYQAAHDAISSSIYNEGDEGLRSRFRTSLASRGVDPGKLETGREIEKARADYPGFRKGGVVKKASVRGKRK